MAKRISILAICLLAALAGYLVLTLMDFASEPSSQAIRSTTAKTTKTLSDCIAELDGKEGGWCEMIVTPKRPSIANVYPEKQKPIHLSMGPNAVLVAWSSAAWDSENMDFYFMGGGGNNYAGNEVYKFSLTTGVWERLTAPTLPTHWAKSKHRFLIPDTRREPAASYINDGLLFNEITKTIILLNNSAADGTRVKRENTPPDSLYLEDGAKPQQYEFNPSSTDTRNGLAPLTWRRIGSYSWGMGRSVQLPDGSLVLGNRNQLYQTAQSNDGQLEEPRLFHSDRKSRGGTLVYDKHRHRLWSMYWDSLVALDLTGTAVFDQKLPITSSRSIAFSEDGTLVSWNGGNRIYSFSPDAQTPSWRVINWKDSGPYAGDTKRVFGKWVHLYDNYFAGISTYKHGVWIYKHPFSNKLGQTLSNTNIQKLVDRAKPGSTIRIPPGLYPSGLKVNRSVTLDLAGVSLMSVSGGKAVLNIDAGDQPVTIKNFSVNGDTGVATTKNLAGIRVSGINFNVTLDNVHIEKTALGVMTDNRGGNLTIKNSTLLDIGAYKRQGLSHVVYAGAIDSLTIDNTSIQKSMHLGHLIKSRALTTTVTDSHILGLDSKHSRVLDIPCGGRLYIQNSILQSSSNSDNQDFISIGVEEEKNCPNGLHDGKVAITNSTLVLDRLSPSNNKNRLFTWRTGIDELLISNNILVNRDGNNLLEQTIDGITLGDIAKNTKSYKSREDAGIPADINVFPLKPETTHWK